MQRIADSGMSVRWGLTRVVEECFVGTVEFRNADFVGHVPVFDVIGRAPRVAGNFGDGLQPFPYFRPCDRGCAKQIVWPFAVGGSSGNAVFWWGDYGFL